MLRRRKTAIDSLMIFDSLLSLGRLFGSCQQPAAVEPGVNQSKTFEDEILVVAILAYSYPVCTAQPGDAADHGVIVNRYRTAPTALTSIPILVPPVRRPTEGHAPPPGSAFPLFPRWLECVSETPHDVTFVISLRHGSPASRIGRQMLPVRSRRRAAAGAAYCITAASIVHFYVPLHNKRV
ncbi:hypothetical protein EVAR_22538_1 [Eumeta japonica]|uniref:Uncharacterized protein n=1 Tax=Eumeta variegata TaxID=151549 RepID=A0A4C1U7A8_EUMVA|nr:hypothetical protein EVAR_22538_1 [Eumeta japonica]